MQLSTWPQAVPLIALVASAVYLPGMLIVAIFDRRKAMDIVALAPLVSIVIAGLSGVAAYPLGLRWNWWSYLAACLIVLVVALSAAGRRRLLTQPERFAPSEDRDTLAAQSPESTVRPSNFWGYALWRSSLPALSGVALAASTIVIRLMRAVPSPEQVTQNYDSVFHDNIVARIMLTGQASSLHALPPIRNVYPIAFQQFAALSGIAVHAASATTAITAAWLVFAGLIWPISMLYLVRAMCGRHVATDFLAPSLSAVCAGFPFLLLDWGTLYSMFAAQTILPVLLALLWQWCRRDWLAGGGRSAAALAWIAVAALAVTFCHFRVMMTALLLAAPLLLGWLSQACALLKRRSDKAFHIALSVGIVALCALLALGARVFIGMYLQGHSRPIADRLNGGPAQPTENISSALGRFVLGQPIDSANQRMPVFWPIAVLVLAAILIALIAHTRESLVLVASFALLGLVFVSSAGTQADWAKIVTALWYKDQRRLFAAWPVAAIALICWAVAYVLDRASLLLAGHMHTVWAFRLSVAALAAAFGLLSCTLNPQLDSMQRAVGATYAFAANGSDDPMLSSDEYLLLRRLGTYVGQDEQVVADPWNGSGFMLAIGRRTPFYAHLSMQWDHDHYYLARHFADIGTDREVCAILQRHDLHWYLDMGGSYAPGDPQHAMFTGLKPVHGAMQAIDRQGRATLYWITACGMGSRP